MGFVRVFALALSILFLSVSCKKDAIVNAADNAQLLIIPEGFPEMDFPEDNQITQSRWELGKKLFFDPILSIDSSISCASCHKPSLAFSDDVALSDGVFGRPGVRNSSSLANVGYHPYMLREGGVPTLEMQVLVPIQEHNELNHNIVDISQILNTLPVYVKMSNEAYGRNPDPFVITRAISVFERTLISGNSAYDQYLKGNTSAMNESEINGMNLFFSSKTDCSSCHGGFNFTNYAFENNGLESQYDDIGRMRFTNDSADLAKFKVPSLRNSYLTAPYMHKGQLHSLEAVVEHYNSGGKNHINKSSSIRPLNLSTEEKADLVAFLKSLTDYDFINDERWVE